MGDVAVEHAEAAAEPVAADPVAAPATGGTPLRAGLSPAGVLALQRGAGNRAVSSVLARLPARPGQRAILRTISDDVFNVTQEINAKTPPDKATVDKAIAVAKAAYAEVQRLQTAKAGEEKIEDAYKLVDRVTAALIAAGADNAAIDWAKTADARVQTGTLNSLRSYNYKGVAGQQSFAIKAGRLAGVTVGAASGTSASWLEAQTEKIGETFKKLEAGGLKGLPNDPNTSLSLTFVAELLKEYFTLSAADVKPDPAGKVGKLTVGQDSKLEADCDVYATYGARLLRAAGWTTVGYMAIIPDASTGRDGHAVALAKRTASGGGATEYVAVSDWMLKEFTATDDDAARDPLLKHGLDIYSSLGEPAHWKSYYLPAGKGGTYDTKLIDPEKNSVPVYKSK
jgi:hypothetical protein